MGGWWGVVGVALGRFLLCAATASGAASAACGAAAAMGKKARPKPIVPRAGMSVWVQIDDDNEPRTYVIDRIEEDEDAGEDQVVLAADGEEAQLPLSEVADLLNGQRAYQEKFVGVVGDGIATGSTQIPPRKKSKKEKPPELTVVICQTTAACPSGLQLGYKLAHVLKRFHQGGPACLPLAPRLPPASPRPAHRPPRAAAAASPTDLALAAR